ncbi:ABC transporter ATP-binding protein [Oceanobacillus caeni]|uniref:Leucine/isoleucine/valine transporter ATP-binding subunit n=1 Tax=Oceanobacillus caeni TaxID=405946 RepID=A0ABR5MN59_9BACI|nr:MULTISPECIES: ABC transporter ATP-binding protein [Bacillaceae]KKE79787.1 leucine/isoleucine/valine transporter ATP-binding subunit [Bacilli bacterium VT-13-104]PZD89498.1 ABC transporter ATP-binding protein [Bacilli bacterium]KPH78461.1 leucine/isoleucine/valine transporter ATP-binding subunit [Oceanobacillus caeni]MBU8789269.1 ABC transporter ATP-binding protein [Oceanobacillus caeni]MCR1832946.1 ABC transporter ATP-binding protein [Oceanobacillus caeni]
MSQLKLKISDLEVKYGSFTALKQINMDVSHGELVVLLGANGAGKSTIFRAISGLNKSSNGEIRFLDQKVNGISPDKLVKLGIVQCAEGRKLFPEMSVYENLQMGAYVHRKNKTEIKKSTEHVYELFPILADKKDDAAGSLSGGQQQMLAIGRSLMAKPKLLLLDEPSLGLAPLIVKQMFEIIQQINQEGTTILLAEQNASAALKIADRGYVIENGRIVVKGTSNELFNNEEIRKAYIGA